MAATVKSLLENLNPTPAFPAYSGPYDVGTLDLEVPASEFRNIPAPPAHSADNLQTIQCRVFYPAARKGEATKNLPTANPVRWLPSPRKAYVAAYARFMGAWPVLAKMVSFTPTLLSYITIPAVSGHPIIQNIDIVPKQFPTIIFSHGLGGTRNTYSQLLGLLASQGIIVFAIEHRDGSAPISFVTVPRHVERHPDDHSIPSSSSSSISDGRQGTKEEEAAEVNAEKQLKDATKSTRSWKRIDYIAHSHELNETTAAFRNKQLEIRFWELGALFSFVQRLNNGYSPSESHIDDIHINVREHLSASHKISLLEMFQGRLDVESPGKTIWAGHSFGAATITQFVKTVFYQERMAKLSSFKTLYQPAEDLHEHFQKPPLTIILDLWTLPLLGKRTRPLWRLPIPGPAMGILSAEFFRWKDNLKGNRHVLSPSGGGFGGIFGKDDDSIDASKPDGVDDMRNTNRERSSSLDVTIEVPGGLLAADESQQATIDKSTTSTPVPSSPRQHAVVVEDSSSSTSIEPSSNYRRLLYSHNSAHLSQSDFGILFDRVIRAFSKTVDNAERTLEYNSRAVVQMLRDQGYVVAGDAEGVEEGIFGSKLEGWESVSLDIEELGAKM